MISASDGYTLLLGTTNLTVLPDVTRVAYHPVRDFSPVSLMAVSANILLLHPSLYARTVKELLVLARGTLTNIVSKLNAVLSGAVAAGDVKQRIAALGAQPAGGAPETIAAHIKAEIFRWSRVIKEAGIRLE